MKEGFCRACWNVWVFCDCIDELDAGYENLQSDAPEEEESEEEEVQQILNEPTTPSSGTSVLTQIWNPDNGLTRDPDWSIHFGDSSDEGNSSLFNDSFYDNQIFDETEEESLFNDSFYATQLFDVEEETEHKHKKHRVALHAAALVNKKRVKEKMSNIFEKQRLSGLLSESDISIVTDKSTSVELMQSLIGTSSVASGHGVKPVSRTDLVEDVLKNSNRELIDNFVNELENLTASNDNLDQDVIALVSESDIPMSFNVPSIYDITNASGGIFRQRPWSNDIVDIQMGGKLPHFPGMEWSWGGDGSFTPGYQAWYDRAFVPWFNNVATDKDKKALMQISCIMNPPEGMNLGYAEWPVIDVQVRDDPNGETKYKWISPFEPDKTYESNNPPSMHMAYYPKEYKDLKLQKRYTFASTRKFANVSDISSRSMVRQPSHTLFEQVSLTKKPIADSTNVTISAGTGVANNMYMGSLVDEVNAWKWMSYTLNGGGTDLGLFVEGSGYPFYNAGNRYRLDFVNHALLYLYTELKTGQFLIGSHFMGFIEFESLVPLATRMFYSGDTDTSPIRVQYESVVSDSAMLVVAPVNAGAYVLRNPVNGLITIPIYISPIENHLFDVSKGGLPYVKLVISPGIKRSIYVKRFSSFRKIGTSTPSYDTLSANLVYTSQDLSGVNMFHTRNVDSRDWNINSSGTGVVRPVNVFSKIFVITKAGSIVNGEFVNGNGSVLVSYGSPSLLEFRVVPIGLGQIFNFQVINNAFHYLSQTTPNDLTGRQHGAYRVQCIDIRDWVT